MVRKIDGSDMTVVVYCDDEPKVQTHNDIVFEMLGLNQ